jgi:hypothetical protein
MATAAFPAKTPGETKLCTFDFTAEAVEGSVISSPVASKALVSGDDTGAALLTLGTPEVVVDTFTVKMLVSGGKDLNKYKITMTVQADNGEVHQLAGTMKTNDAAA